MISAYSSFLKFLLGLPERLLNLLLDQPVAHLSVEGFLIVLVIYLLTQKMFDPRKRSDIGTLSRAEEDAIIEMWKPEPLEGDPLTDSQLESIATPIVSSSPGAHIVVDGKEVINMGAANFLGLSDDERIENVAKAALAKYGCGSCGPRGFYGTIDVHLDLEAQLASFLGTGDAILFASYASAIATSIPAFAKRSDLILCDDGVHWPVLEGCLLSRATLLFYKHNDMHDLERILQDIADKDMKRGEFKLNRRFIIAEAVSVYHGDVLPLDELVILKNKYAFRLIIDESHSIGVLGASGKGISEHFGLPIEEIELITGCLGRSFCSVGGFTAGSASVVDHQRLSAPGYVFSASPPPFLTVAASTALSVLSKEVWRVSVLHSRVARLREGLIDVKNIDVLGDSDAANIPIIVDDVTSVCKSLCDCGVAVARLYCDRLPQTKTVALKHTTIPSPPIPSLCLFVSASHTDADIDKVVDAIRSVCE